MKVLRKWLDTRRLKYFYIEEIGILLIITQPLKSWVRGIAIYPSGGATPAERARVKMLENERWVVLVNPGFNTIIRELEELYAQEEKK